jgi:hypothetical protein
MNYLTFSEAEYQSKTQYTTRDLSGTDGQANSLEAARKDGG